MHFDPTAIVVALISFAGAALGIYVSRKGQRRSEALDQQRHEVDRITKTYDTQQRIIETLQAERDHLEQARQADAERHERELAGRDIHIDQLTSALATLQSIVTEEIEEAAIDQFADDDTPETRQAIKEFMRTMRQIGGSR